MKLRNISYQFLHLQNRLLAGLMYAKTTAAKEKKLRFDITISDYTCPCHCTDIELVDLVGILIDNAINASHENDTIFITIDRMQDRFLFRIENPGPKADSAFLSKIFRPGYTTKEHSIGHGVGLSILRKTIQKYHGDVIVSNTYGEVSETSRSDVNLIAVVNPKTYQILLVTTPRDYYVPIPGVSGGQKDKLTHAGIYGIDASMRTLGELYETDINYYASPC